MNGPLFSGGNQFGGSYDRLNFDKFRDTASLRSEDGDGGDNVPHDVFFQSPSGLLFQLLPFPI